MPWFIRFLRGIEIGLYAIIFTMILGGGSLVISDQPSDVVRRYTRSVEFDYVSWSLDALAIKMEQAALGTPFYFSEIDRHRIVLDYLQLMDTILNDENQLSQIYSNPQINDPGAASNKPEGKT